MVQHTGAARCQRCGRLTAYLVERDPAGASDPRGCLVPCQATLDCNGALALELPAGSMMTSLKLASELAAQTCPKCSAEAHTFFDGSSLAFEFCQECRHFTTLAQDQL